MTQTYDKVIVTTTINPPTPALLAFDAMEDWHLVVVGDLKTPHDAYAGIRGTYLHPTQQVAIDTELSQEIDWNCIQRRNFGFLWAHDHGARVVATVDDDNVPLLGWGSSADLLRQTVSMTVVSAENHAVDPINYSTGGGAESWHRGFPIQELKGRYRVEREERNVVPLVVADIWEGDPDVDAICRMTFEETNLLYYDHAFPFTSANPAPFNSQNTFLDASLLKDYFMFPGVGRMDDIFGAYHLEAVTGVRPVFNRPSVRQDRNLHDLTKDFEQEVLGYRHCYKICERIQTGDPEAVMQVLEEENLIRSMRAFHLYQRHFG